MTAQIVIYGAGGFAREVAWLMSRRRDTDLLAFIDNTRSGNPYTLDGCPVPLLDEAARNFPASTRCVVAVGDPALRETLVQRATAAGFAFHTLTDPSAHYSRRVQIGEGSIICAGSILTVDITIGRHVHVNLNCTVGHDAVLEDFVTLAPGVHVSGWVHIERGAYIGTGAAIINGAADKPLVIGARSVVGAGAVVTRDIPAGVTAVGVPAKARP